jgi:hypothetical protein
MFADVWFQVLTLAFGDVVSFRRAAESESAGAKALQTAVKAKTV